MPIASNLIRVALPVPVASAFDYVWSGAGGSPAPGCRVRVPFGRGERIGVVLSHPAATHLPSEKLRGVDTALDDAPVVDAELLETLCWAADYYHHPIGDVVLHALPELLRKGRSAEAARSPAFRLTAVGREVSARADARLGVRQAAVVEALSAGTCLAAETLRAAGATADALRRLERNGWIEPCEPFRSPGLPRAQPRPDAPLPELTPDQATVLARLERHASGFGAFLLHGVTGSGKTEIFLRLIGREIVRGRQTLLLVPEIGLTPQLVARLRERFGGELAIMHSGLSATERTAAWRAAHTGEAMLIVGTRSAIFAPLPAPGLIVVDEEHDASYKQQEGFKYSARDLAVVRARSLDIPVLLASATPSLESMRNAHGRRYRLLELPSRIGAAGAPAYRVVDLKVHATRHGLSTPLVSAMTMHLEQGSQVLLFLNRRGFAPALFCPQCEKAEECDRCDARLTVHARRGVLVCHHCGREVPLRWSCQRCGTERIGVGAGTQRVDELLQSLFPERRIARLDRDVTTRRGALETVLGDVARGDTDILVGTQMLTKGHDFPRVTLVGILNADQGLFGTDFRSDERLAQTIVQVGGRAGRRDLPGEVVIQTHFPGHPLLRSLLTRDYAAFATLALEERRAAGWPPFSHLAVLRAEGPRPRTALDFLARLGAHAARRSEAVQVLGPAPAAMERKGDRYRAHLLLKSEARAALHLLVGECLAAAREWPESRRLRWGVDVDPTEI